MTGNLKESNNEIINEFKKIHERLDKESKRRDTAFIIIGILIFMFT